MRNYSRMMVMLFVSCFLLAAGTAAGETKIAFACEDEFGDVDICVVNPDGSGVTNLTNTANVYERVPSWSANGTQIAYFGFPDEGVGGLYVMDADGGNAQLIVDESLIPEGASLSWSPELPNNVAAISPFGQFVLVFMLGGMSAAWMMRKRGLGEPEKDPAVF